MAARGSAGLLLCVGLLLAMPALAATPADRDACAASADKPDLGGAACDRIIGDAGEPVAERIKALKNRGRGAFNKKDYDRAIADYGEAIKLGPKDADGEDTSRIVKAVDLSGVPNLLFRRNSTTGEVEVLPRKGQTVELNEALHAN